MTTTTETVSAWPRWMHYPAMATYSGVSEMTLRRLVDAGRLHVSKPTPRTALLDRLEVDRYLEECAGRNECQEAG
ncbi:MAG TPA: hypothetical protein VH682_03435 [Gemmataceae bacterium]|jgi:excisionase family DNA binding protein